MAASIKPMLYASNKKADGTFPLVIRVIQDRKVTYIPTGYSLLKEDWNEKERLVKKSFVNSGRLNHLLSKKLAEITAQLLDASITETNISNKQLAKNILSKNKNSFKALATEHLKNLYDLKKFNQYYGEVNRFENFYTFLENEDISFKQIDINLLKKYMLFLKINKGLSERTVMNCLVVIRTVFNKAIESGIIDQKYYPFGKGKIKIKYPESIKSGLNKEEITLLEESRETLSIHQKNAVNLFLFSFYMAGIRVSDILKLKWNDISDGRLNYVMGKNKKIISLKIPEKASLIIEFYIASKKNSIYVFPYMEGQGEESSVEFNRKTRGVNSYINQVLNEVGKKIGVTKKISMHISRHSFGTIAGTKIPPQVLQRLYRHSNLSTTIGYQNNFIYDELDSALDKVIA